MKEESGINEILHELGLLDNEIMVYLCMVKIRSGTIGKIMEHVQFDRTKIYRCLDKLKSLCLITTTFSNPALHVIIEPKKALAELLQIRENKLAKLTKDVNVIVESFQKFNMDTEDIGGKSLVILSGTNKVYSRMIKLFNEATSTIYLITNRADLMKLYYTSLPESIEKLNKRGIEIRLITKFDHEDIFECINRLGNFNVRHGTLPHDGRIICEKNHLIMSNNMKTEFADNDKTQKVLYTDITTIAGNIFEFCELFWKKCKPMTLEALMEKSRSKN